MGRNINNSRNKRVTSSKKYGNSRFNPTTPPVNTPKNFIVNVTPTCDLDEQSKSKNNTTNHHSKNKNNTRIRSLSEQNYNESKTIKLRNPKNNNLYPVMKKQKSREEIVFETYINNSPT